MNCREVKTQITVPYFHSACGRLQKKVPTKFKNFTNILGKLLTRDVVNEYFECHEQVCEQVCNPL